MGVIRLPFSRLHLHYMFANVPIMAVQNYRGFSVLVPLVGIASGALKLNSAAIFIFNTIALIPLGSWINRSVDALSVDGMRAVNELLKSTLGNSVELMVTPRFYLPPERELISISSPLDRDKCDRPETTTCLTICDPRQCAQQPTTGELHHQKMAVKRFVLI
jgi:hypothetical protein